MITVGESQLYSMLTIFFGVAEWTPDSMRIWEIAHKLGDALLCSELTRVNAVARFEANVAGRRDFLARGGRIS